jgi:hypothetical protein
LRPFAYNDRVLALGQTQSGKTTAMQRWVLSMGPQIRVVDPKGRLQLGVEPVYDVEAIDWRQRIVHWRPRRFTRDEYERIYEAFWLAGGPAVVWTDECAGVGPTTGSWAPTFLIALQAQGAEHGIGHYYCSQRYQNIAVPLRTEVDHVVVFAPPPPRIDLDVLARDIDVGPDVIARELRELQAAEGLPYTPPVGGGVFMVWTRSEPGELTPCAPLPIGGHRPAPAPPAAPA